MKDKDENNNDDDDDDRKGKRDDGILFSMSVGGREDSIKNMSVEMMEALKNIGRDDFKGVVIIGSFVDDCEHDLEKGKNHLHLSRMRIKIDATEYAFILKALVEDFKDDVKSDSDG